LPRGRFVPRLESLEDRTVLSTLTVTSALDDGSSGTLRSVIAGAKKNDKIVFASNLDGDTITLAAASGQLAISKNLDIEGPGASLLAISGGNATRVFNVSTGVTLTIGGLTIENGFADQGGGIDNQGTLTLSQDTISANEAKGDSLFTGIGGGVFNAAGASLSVDHCTISNNQSVGNVGRGWGGAILNEGTANVTATTFTGNVSTGGSEPGQPDGTGGVGYGGGIASVYGSTLTVSNSTFSNNQSIDGLSAFDASGGAIGTFLSSVTVSNCTFNSNQALANSTVAIGGAIRSVLDTAFSVTNCTFRSNQAIGFTKADGGAVSDEGETATVTNSTFSNNQAIGTGPGALTFGGAIENANVNTAIPTLTLTNCTLTGNESLGGAGGDGVNTFGFAQGGGIDSGGNVTLQNTTFTNNLVVGGAMAPGAPPSATATSVGGGLSMDLPATLIVTNSAFTGNKVVGGAGTSTGPGIAAFGGGIEDFSGGSATITNTTFTNNQAVGGAGTTTEPGGDGFGGGIDISYTTAATITGTTFTGNEALGGSGANVTVPAVDNGSSGAGIGGAISLGAGVLFATADTSSLVLSNCTLSGNVAQGGAGLSGGNGGEGWGGGIAELAGTATLTNNTLSSNSAIGGPGGSGGDGGNGFGGGLYVASGATATLCSDTVQSNAASSGSGTTNGQGFGGGLYIQSGATAYLDAYTVAHTTSNTADIDPNIDGAYILQSC
jgi:hypothetical protein